MKIALVYDRVNKMGGAERVLMALHEIWPEAPLYTAVYNKETAPWADGFDVRPSFLQNFPLAKTRHDLYPWLTPLAFESFNFDDYDVVISVTSAEAKGIITKPKTLHICYCLTPTRYLWSGFDDYINSSLKKFLSKPFVSYLRKWDKIASSRPDKYIAISKEVQSRIKKYYGHESEVIYPPVNTSSFWGGAYATTPESDSGRASLARMTSYFLVVSRLVPYKKVDLVVKTFNKLPNEKLIIVGTGSEETKLKNIASKNITFTGLVGDNELSSLYQNAKALIFPSLEDFGIVPVEAQAHGLPVIAYRGGGALETVIEGKTGIFFNEQTVESLTGAISDYQDTYHRSIKSEDCIENAKRFDKEIFKNKLREYVTKAT